MHRINKLAELFIKFPGIGPRQAKRFVYFLLRQDKDFLDVLSHLIEEIKNAVMQCVSCYRFFDADGYSDICDICSSPNRDKEILLILEKDADLEAIEKSNSYNGLYFVLGGTVPLFEQNPDSLRTAQLLRRIEKDAAVIKEIVLATSASPEGDNTAQYIRHAIQQVSTRHEIALSTLGRGLSTGTELEYSDRDTIRNALINRK